MGRSDRLFEIIQLLRRARRPLTAEKIALSLEVTVRTVYRDIAALQAMRVPIEGETGVGYRMRPGFDLPPLMFTSDEVEAIMVGLALLRRTGDKGLLQAAQGVKRKIADVLPKALQHVIEQTALHVSAYGIAAPATVDIQRLRAAIRVERKLLLTYKDDAGQETQRTVLPLAVFYYVEVAVLVGWCILREDFRHFRVDRISACSDLDEFFKDKGEGLRARWLADRESSVA